MAGVLALLFVAGCSDAAYEERMQHELYCDMVSIWEADEAKGIRAEERSGWPPYKGECRVNTKEVLIDAALDSVLKASGSALRHYTMPKSLADMREAMRKVISDAYIKGSNDTIEAIKKAGHNAEITGQL
jgi:hypothetical protein